MQDYTIAKDAHGNYYLCHGVEWKNHKYIKKIGKGISALYFYTPDELKRYLQNVAKTAQQTGQNIKTAGQEVAKKMQIASETANAVKSKAQEVSQRVQSGMRQTAKETKSAAGRTASEVKRVAKEAKDKINSPKKAVSLSTIQRSLTKKSDSSNGLKKLISEATGKKSAVTKGFIGWGEGFDKANNIEKATTILKEADSIGAKLDDMIEAKKSEIESYMANPLAQAIYGPKDQHNHGSSEGTSKEPIDDPTHGFGSHKKNVSGSAKAGWANLRDEDGNNPHAENQNGNHLLNNDDVAAYVEQAEKKIEELGGYFSPSGKEYYAQVMAELSVVAAAQIVDAYESMEQCSNEIERCKKAVEAEKENLVKLQQKQERDPGSVKTEEILWARDRIEVAITNQLQAMSQLDMCMEDIDTWWDNLEYTSDECNSLTNGQKNWWDVVGIDERFSQSAKKR